MSSRTPLAAWGYLLLVLLGLTAPFFVYPVFAMNVLCLALFASAFNLLLGYTGLLSFGHAAFLGAAAYVPVLTVKAWGLPPPRRDWTPPFSASKQRRRSSQELLSVPGSVVFRP